MTSTHIPHDGWHSGPPPSIGWWAVHADFVPMGRTWAYWNGKWWGYRVTSVLTASDAAKIGSRAGSVYASSQRWSHYYPEGARVQRVKP